MRTIQTRNAGEVGSHKHRVEWALARALTAYEPRLVATEVPVVVSLGDGRIRRDAVLRYETESAANAEELTNIANAYISGWFDGLDKCSVR